MPYLLNVFYVFLILAALPWLLVQAVRKGKYREGYAAKFLGLVPRRTSQRTCVWLHAVSVGEVNLLAPLLRLDRRNSPRLGVRRLDHDADRHGLGEKEIPRAERLLLPAGFHLGGRPAMRRIRPDLLVLAELELWPNLVRAARRSGVRVAVINGRLSEHSFAGYRRIRPLAAAMLRQIDLLAVQDAVYAQRFLALGADPRSLYVTGSMKYDGAGTDRRNPATLRLAALAGFQPDDIVLLAGSTQEPEEAAVLDVFRRLQPAWPKLRLVLVPRHPERFEGVGRMLDAAGVAWQRRTDLTLSEGPVPTPCHARILLVDVVGELGAWWGTAQIAFVGGSLGNRGGQNMIEPAAYGAAVCFGPNTRNFRDIVATMLARQAAVVVADAEQLAGFVRRCLEDPAYAAALGDRAGTWSWSSSGPRSGPGNC